MRKIAFMAAFMAALGLALSSGAASAFIWGAKGNDTGGIIPWSPENEAAAQATADSMCASASWSRKAARITTMRRVYGDYIVYECYFTGPLRRNGPG